jgi:LacI family transcriptional regulator
MLDSRTYHQDWIPDGWPADGVLTYIARWEDLSPRLRASRPPIVNMAPAVPGLDLPTVRLDNHRVGVLAAEHLLGRGFGNLAMLQFNPKSPTSSARRLGFESTVVAAGRRFHELVCPHQGPTEVLKPQLAWLRRQLPDCSFPLGVFTEGDLWGVELIHVCQQLGLAVPGQVAVVGVDNDPLAVDVAPVPLTSVDTNLRGLGFRAAELLDQILSGAQPPTTPILIPPIGVVQRQSSDVLAVDDSDLAAAIRYIHDRFRQPITVDDVAAQTTTSRRRLYGLFADHLGRTISAEITRCRVELAKQLLQQTGLKVGAIAERAGFGNAVQMTKVFTRELGLGPARYRRECRIGGTS